MDTYTYTYIYMYIYGYTCVYVYWGEHFLSAEVDLKSNKSINHNPENKMNKLMTTHTHMDMAMEE